MRLPALSIPLFGLALLSANGSAAAEARKIGVIAVGVDAEANAAAAEARLAQLPGVTVWGNSVLAPMAADAAPSDDGAKTVEDKLGEVSKAYYAGKIAEAQTRLDEARGAADKSKAIPAAALGRVGLWSAALKLKKGDKAGAETQLQIALTTVPDLAPGDEIPPAVTDLLPAARKKAPKFFHLTVTGLAAGATLRADGAVVDAASFAATVGPHKLEAVKPGFRPATRVVDVSADASIALVMAPGFPPATESAIATAAAAGAAAPAQINALAQKAGVESILAITSDATSIKAAIWTHGKVPAVLPAAKHGAIAPLLDSAAIALGGAPPSTPTPTPVAVATLAPTPAPTAVKTATPAPTVAVVATPSPTLVAVAPTPVATPTILPAGAASNGLRTEVDARLESLTWSRAIDEADKKTSVYSYGVSGFGPSVRVDLTSGPLLLEGGFRFSKFGELKTTTSTTSQQVTLSAGSLTMLRTGAGAIFPVAGSGDEGWRLGGLVTFNYEIYNTSDLVVNGVPQKVFPSFSHSYLDIALIAGTPRARRLSGSVMLGYDQQLGYTEKPVSSGRSPKATAGLTIGGEGSWRVGRGAITGGASITGYAVDFAAKSIPFGTVNEHREESMLSFTAGYRIAF